MPQVTLYAPDITCDHCIATIGKAVGTVEGARFLAGDPDSKTFSVEIASGAVLDRVAETLAEEGYPLGEASAPGAAAAPVGASAHPGMTVLGTFGMPSASAPAAGTHHAPTPGFVPQYLKVERTEAGADITYSCPCGSTTEVFRLDRSQEDQPPHSCCGHHTLIGADAAERLRARLGADAARYDIDVQTVTMPWGQPLEAAQAAPKG
ncbi:MAG: copper chaperone [Chloroflexi bacterium]|nr:MAG: copper chaperone [Chloroflexota bacterium]